MKGIAHFVAGVAAASCVPEAVARGAEGDPTYFILGGVFGLLPDTIDFKFTRFFYHHEIIVTPDPNRPDAQAIADDVAEAINRADREGRRVTLKLNTVQVGMDRWQAYRVTFDTAAREVVVTYGPVVDTGQNPLPGGSPAVAEGRAPLRCGLKLEYLATTTVDIFDGPTFEMKPTGDGRVAPGFIPWHRAWSHSVVVALVGGLVGALIWGPWALAVIAGAAAMHALFDQLGYMGSALFYPFSRRRIPGLKLMHSGEAAANFAAVWVCLVVIFWNLARHVEAETPVAGGRDVFLYGLLVPMGVLLVYRWLRRRGGDALGLSTSSPGL